MGWFGDSKQPEKKIEEPPIPEIVSSPPELTDSSLFTINGLPNYSSESFSQAFQYFKQCDDSTQQVLFVGGCLISFGLGIVVGRVRPFASWHRIRNLQDIPSSSIGPQARYFRGRAVSVSDGDTFRFYHVPTIFHTSRFVASKEHKLSEHTWPVRVCTIDTPETSKFGNPGQPFGEEAKTRVEQLLLNRMVDIQILTRDQYGRAVAQVRVGRVWPFQKYADQVLLEAGLAEVYRGSGAVYGSKGLEYYNRLEAKAQKRRKGIWSLGDQRESAAEYKAKHKEH